MTERIVEFPSRLPVTDLYKVMKKIRTSKENIRVHADANAGIRDEDHKLESIRKLGQYNNIPWDLVARMLINNFNHEWAQERTSVEK